MLAGFYFAIFNISCNYNRSISLDSQNVKSLLRCVKCCITLGDLNEAKRLCAMIKQLESANTELPSLVIKL